MKTEIIVKFASFYVYFTLQIEACLVCVSVRHQHSTNTSAQSRRKHMKNRVSGWS